MRAQTLLPAIALLAAMGGPARAVVTEDSFLLRNTGDLVDLCTDQQTDRLYTAASNFCQGFAVGVFRVLQEEDAAHRLSHMFCVPEPMPSRNEGIVHFVEWAKADPTRLQLPPADGIATYLVQRFPCPHGR